MAKTFIDKLRLVKELEAKLVTLRKQLADTEKANAAAKVAAEAGLLKALKKLDTKTVAGFLKGIDSVYRLLNNQYGNGRREDRYSVKYETTYTGEYENQIKRVEKALRELALVSSPTVEDKTGGYLALL